MSWQSKFDASGARWEDSASALAEEKRLNEMMESNKAKNIAKGSDFSNEKTLNELNISMDELYKIEKRLMKQVEMASSEDEITDLTSQITIIRLDFKSLKNQYIKIKVHNK